ncbi:MAG TPA: hypothetical protein VF176_03135 [Solirubrobacterales bacterium]
MSARGRHALPRTIAALTAAIALLLCSGSERAEGKVPIYAFATSLKAIPGSSQAAQAAGAHSDLKIDFSIGTPATEPAVPCLCNAIKEITINTPSGVVGTPANVPRCTAAEFSASRCPVESQIGIVALDLVEPGENTAAMAIFNMVPRPDQLALFAFATPVVPSPIYSSFTARTESDYGLEVKTYGIPTLFPPYRVTYYLWGVPADPVHDTLRVPLDNWGPPEFSVLSRGASGCNTNDPRPAIDRYEFPTLECPAYAGSGAVASAAPSAPFLSNPTTCGGPLSATMRTDAYDLDTDFATTSMPATTDCDQLSFDPSLAAKPTTSKADSPSGLDIDLTVPQTLSPSTPSPSAIRAAKIELPAGFTINPNAADGKLSCTDVQAKFGTRDPAQCPEHSKIGTLGITSASFPGVLPGAIYLGEPKPGNRYRIFLVADGFSLHVKQLGTVTPDPNTGQLMTTLQDLPQFNFQEFKMHLFGAEKGLLSTPERCGTYPVHSTFTPWAAPDIPEQTSTQFFTIDSGPNGTPCPGLTRPFGPSFDAGVTDNTAGGHSTFSLDLKRPDGDQSLIGLKVATPPGFAATLKGIPYCPEAAIAQLSNSLYTGLSEIASSACSAESQVGTAVAAAGTGSKPFYVNGKAYLAGPYKGAPLSLVVVIPAVSGPYDLGNVAVRAAIDVDPVTAQVTTTSDPLPLIREGIPLRTREIRVDLDRPDFALNPTNCSPLSVEAQASGDEGGVADLSSHFQIANCAVLGFEPELAVKVLGPMKRVGHPRLRAILKTNAGEANLARTVVALPHSEFLDSTHIRSVCTRADFAANSCPPGSVYGRAAAFSPLLDDPLRGPVYLRSSGKELPDLVADLHGQFDIEVSGHIDSDRNQGIRTTFDAIPDVPVSKFVLNMQSGRKGLIQNSKDLCAGAGKVTVKMDGQNGRLHDFRSKLDTACKKRKRHRRAGIARARSALR